jgi:hypothetical protein
MIHKGRSAMKTDHRIEDRVSLLEDFNPDGVDILSIDPKHRFTLPSYYRNKTAARLDFHAFPKSLAILYALIREGNGISLHDAVSYERAIVGKTDLQVSERSLDGQGRILIPDTIYAGIFSGFKQVRIFPSANKDYVMVEPFRS